MSGLDGMHADELAARLGLPLGTDMAARIEAHVVRAMPEPHGLEDELLAERPRGVLTDAERAELAATAPTGPECWCTAPRYDGDDGWDRDCPAHGMGGVIG